MKPISIGNDAEFILTTSDGKPLSAIGLIGGSKLRPRPVNLGALQEDNVLAEINIQPATTLKQWDKHILSVMHQLSGILPMGYEISNLASALYPDEELFDPKSQEFGCDPDINAWTGKVNKFPVLPKKLKNFRSAGGHVHIGRENLNLYESFKLIQVLDMIAGLQSVHLDKDTARKKLYGKAGAMRIKSYGVEWRTPSNFWVFEKTTRQWMFIVAKFCATHYEDLFKLISKEVEHIINNNAKPEALFLLKSIYKKIKIPIHPNIKV